jgi:hypothetical protein
MHRSIVRVAATSLVALTLTACTGDSGATAPAPSSTAATALLLSPRPPRSNPEDFVDIVAGDYHTCARKVNQKVYCWGKDNLGQGGSRTTTTCNTVACFDRPTLVMTPSAGGDSIFRATQLDAGRDHTCALDANGTAWCWGDNAQGQLGFPAGVHGTPGEPLRVVGKLSFSSIGAGSASTCGIAATGMYCWGKLMQAAAQPTLVSSYNGYSVVAVGDLHACTMQIVGSYRAVDCWGSNSYGQIGNDPVQLPTGPFTVRAQFGTSVGRVSTQQNVTCVDQTSGTVQCVGDNGFYQLGLPSSVWWSGVPQTIGNGQLLHSVSAGMYHVCALDVNNAAWCWGMGFSGELGNGQAFTAQAPQAVTGGHTYRAIASGYQHTCAIGTDNHIYCWGFNDFGQLGAQIPNHWVTTPVTAIDP